jgi:hypothetical protein
MSQILGGTYIKQHAQDGSLATAGISAGAGAGLAPALASLGRELLFQVGVRLAIRAYWLFPLGYNIASGVNGGPPLPGKAIVNAIGGTEVIPRGTNLALGFSNTLDQFARARNAVSIFTAWDRQYLNIPFLADPEVLIPKLATIARTFIGNGGRIQFNLTGLNPRYVPSVTGDELRTILAPGNGDLLRATDFFENGKELLDEAREAALQAWRQ